MQLSLITVFALVVVSLASPVIVRDTTEFDFAPTARAAMPAPMPLSNFRNREEDVDGVIPRRNYVSETRTPHTSEPARAQFMREVAQRRTGGYRDSEML